MPSCFRFVQRHSLATLLLAAASAAQAQTGGVRVGTAGAPEPSAVLDLRPDAATAPKGFLPPRLSTTQRDAIAAPAAGLTVFNTTTNQLNVWDGSRWVGYLVDTTPVPFTYTGAPQTYTVPAGIRSLQVTMAGAAGGPRYFAGTGQGLGGRVQALLAVTPGQVLTIYVGGAGAANAGGYNGGGGARSGDGGGGGASDIRRGGTALTDRVLVAGGGGGGGDFGDGGCGGGLTACTGNTSSANTGGGGGDQTSPGAGGTGANNGSPGAGNVGGDGNGYSGGGGGGYFGGGSGGGTTGGGGGSSYAGLGTSAVVHTQGVQTGAGYVQLTPLPGNTPAPVLDASNFTNLPPAQTLSLSGQNLSISGGNTVAIPGDNLGNHTATQNLNLGANQLVGNGSTGLAISSTGNVGIGTTTPDSPLEVAGVTGDIHAGGVVLARAIVVTEYQSASGPGPGSNNQQHTAQCASGWGITTAAVQINTHADGNMIVNCANLTYLLRTTGTWRNGPDYSVDNQTHINDCLSNEIATGLRFYASDYFDGGPDLFCQQVAVGVRRGAAFDSALRESLFGRTSTTVQFGCPAGTYMVGLRVGCDDYIGSSFRPTCATLTK